ncbi:MAG: carboxypeptidase-like regulatory domain-containing protein [Bacteroidota bacterium]
MSRGIDQFLLVLSLIWCCQFSYAQNNILDHRITISFNGQSVKEALKMLEKEVDCYLTYSNLDVDLSRKISKQFQNVSLREIIGELWGERQIKLRTKGNTIGIILDEEKSSPRQGNLFGIITGDKGESVSFATVAIKGSGKGVIAGEDGIFSINQISAAKYTLAISSAGYEPKEVLVEVRENQTVKVEINMSGAVSALDEVVVLGKSVEQKKREDPIKIEVIDVKAIQSQSISIPQVMNQAAGIKVRQAGGIGSPTVININGLQGQAIRIFRDGIPMDYMGRAFDINILPVDQVDNIEVYKGVLPVDLGADALGGAINYVSKGNGQNNLSASYGIGSFNSHQLNLTAHLNIPQTKFFTSLGSYYIRSDNNFKMDVQVPDPVTRNLTETEIERFHDGIHTWFAEFSGGVANTKWADLLKFSYANFDLNRDLQNNVFLTRPYGEIFETERSSIFSSQYELNRRKNTLKLFGAYSKRRTVFDDTPKNTYDWFGNATPINPESNEGELERNKSRRRQNFKTWTARLVYQYAFREGLSLNFSHLFQDERRVGRDDFYVPISIGEQDPLSFPGTYVKNISGLQLSSDIGKRIETIFAVKRYGIFAELATQRLNELSSIDPVEVSNFGLASSLKYSITSDAFFRISYERTTRIPTTLEYFGDGAFTLSNSALRPEQSHNINLGFYGNLNSKKNKIDLNLFYRAVEDNVFLRQFNIFYSQFQNLDDARVWGAETAVKGELVPNLKFQATLTYQDIRRVNIENPGERILENSRQPNIPYFFGNLGVTYKPEKQFLNGSWQVYTNYAYTEQFILFPLPKELEPPLFGNANEVQGASIIPTQHLIDVGLTYNPSKLPIWLNVEINNALNVKAFDGYRIQRPGRFFRIKLSYRLEPK